jgi:phosphatidylglycerol lysyltransferase
VSSETTAAGQHSADSSRNVFARLRWIIPTLFLAVVAWLLWHEVGEFPLPDIQKTLLDVPTLPMLGVGALALFAVAFTGLVDWLIGRWLKLELHARDFLRPASSPTAWPTR